MGGQPSDVRPLAVPARQALATLGLIAAAVVVWAGHALRFGGDGWYWYAWNLWLAVIPLGVSTWLALLHRSSSSARLLRWPVLAPALLCWLLFFQTPPTSSPTWCTCRA